MRTQIQIFNHDTFGNIRTMTNENGEPLFIGKDVALALGYSNTRDALNKHVDQEDKGTVAIRDTAYETRAIVINESGLYSLILSSKLEQARVFKRWVTSEVLPQIRKTGSYNPVRKLLVTDTDVMKESEQIQGRELECLNGDLSKYVTTTEIAKMYGMETSDLISFLRDMHVLMPRGRQRLTGQYAESGLAEDRHCRYYSLKGELKESVYLVWTEKGRDFINKMIN